MINKLKLKNEIYKLIKFAATGIISASVDCTVYYLLLNFAKINFALIQPVSISAGLCCSFLFARGFVFKKEKMSFSTELVKYLIVCAVCILLSPLVITFYSLWLGRYYGKIPATLTTGLINYILNRLFVYNGVSINNLFKSNKTEKGKGSL